MEAKRVGVVAADNIKVAKRIKNFAAKIALVKFDIELITAKKAEAIFKRRVFNSGMNAEGERMGTKSKKRTGVYSYYYGKKRKAKGRRTNVMDFQMNGDLFQSIQVVESGSVPTLKITNSRTSKIAGYLETQQQADIFSLSDSERMDVKNYMRKAIDREIKKIK